MSSSKDSQFDDYIPHREPANNLRGYRITFAYHGDWYAWSAPKARLRLYRLGALLALLVAAAAFVFAGVQQTAINTTPAVAIVSVFSIVALLYEGIGVAQFCIMRKKMTARAMKTIRRILFIAPLLHAGLLFAAAAIGLALVRPLAQAEVLTLAGYIVSGMASLALCFFFRRFGYNILPAGT